MQNRINATGLIPLIRCYHTESLCIVEVQSRMILLVNIYTCRTLSFCKFHKGGTKALSPVCTVDKEHFNRILS